MAFSPRAVTFLTLLFVLSGCEASAPEIEPSQPDGAVIEDSAPPDTADLSEVAPVDQLSDLVAPEQDAAADLDARVSDSATELDTSLDADSSVDAADGVDAADVQEVSPLPPPLVLLHLSDIHFGSGDFAVPALQLATTEIIPTVQPRVTFASGDLVEVGNNAEAWDEYMTVIDQSGLDAQNYIEVPGNHDIYLDPQLTGYLGHTLAGRAGLGTHGIYSLDTEWGRLRVLALDTVSSGDPIRDSTGYLDPEQVAVLTARLEAETQPAAITIAVGHHPIEIDGLSLFNTDDDLLRLLGTAQANAYLFGHRHFTLFDWRGSCLFSMARTLGNPGDEGELSRAGFNLLVFDDGLAARGVPLDEENISVAWPLVMITRPADPGLGFESPLAHSLPRNTTNQLLRAVAFAPEASPVQVRYRVDQGPWEPMQRVQQHYEARFSTPNAERCELEVEATTSNGASSRDLIQIELL